MEYVKLYNYHEEGHFKCILDNNFSKYKYN